MQEIAHKTENNLNVIPRWNQAMRIKFRQQPPTLLKMDNYFQMILYLYLLRKQMHCRQSFCYFWDISFGVPFQNIHHHTMKHLIKVWLSFLCLVYTIAQWLILSSSMQILENNLCNTLNIIFKYLWLPSKKNRWATNRSAWI